MKKSLFDFTVPPITTQVQEQAYNNPGGFVYAIDKKYDKAKDVPPEAILGAWKVDEKGKIIKGSFKRNPNYKE